MRKFCFGICCHCIVDHFDLDAGDFHTADDFYTGTKAAIAGGTTSILDFTTQEKGQTLTEVLDVWHKMADGKSSCDYGFHMSITDWNDESKKEIKEMTRQGVTSYKLYMAYDNLRVNDKELFEILSAIEEEHGIAGVHCENGDIIKAVTEKLKAEERHSIRLHPKSRPAEAEAEAVNRLLTIAKLAGTPVNIVHLSSRQGLKVVQRARKEGQQVFVETCPQYLEFTSDVYKLENARNFVCSPPMKGEESRQALWAAIRRGDIDTIATDHCPFQSYEKDWGKDDFTKIPNGCAGIENMYPYMLSAANSGEITFEQAVALCSTNPARIFGCQKKGAIAVGMDADLVVYDPEMDFVITNDKMHSDCDHTIWEGCKLHGYPVQTYSRGRLVYENGEFLGEAGWGNFVKCKLK